MRTIARFVSMSDKMNLNEIATPRRWELDNPSPRGGQITIAGWDFGGEGPLALLHHANGMCAALWALVAQPLTKHYRVIAVDARGHGDSDRLSVPDDYHWDYFVSDLAGVARSLLEEYGEEKITLGLGSSFGGIVTAATQARHDLYRRVVMLDPPLHPNEEMVKRVGLEGQVVISSEREGLVEQTLKRRSVWPSRDAAREAWADKPLFAPWQDEAFDIYLNEGMGDAEDGTVYLKCDPTVEAHIFQSTGSLNVLDFAHEVAVPVTLAYAGRGFFPELFFRKVVELFPNGRFVTLDGGHMLPLEVPEMVVELVLEGKT